MSTGHEPAVVTITPLRGIPEVVEGDDLAGLLLAALRREGLTLSGGDILAVSSKVVSKALGLTAPPHDKDAVVASQTIRVVAERSSDERITRIVEAAAGPVMAAAGVDASNTGGRDVLLLLPRDPDEVCRDLHACLCAATGIDALGVVLTDTAGRPWRTGQTDLALGAHGVQVLEDLRGHVDSDGRVLLVTARALADELAASADLVKGKTSDVPAALIRGLAGHVLSADAAATAAGARSLVRTADSDWFSLGTHEAVRAALGVGPGTAQAHDAGLRPVHTDPTAARVARAIAVAFRPQVEPWHSGTEVTANPDLDELLVSGPDAFSVGVVTARLQVALAGEDVDFTATAAADVANHADVTPRAAVRFTIAASAVGN